MNAEKTAVKAGLECDKLLELVAINTLDLLGSQIQSVRSVFISSEDTISLLDKLPAKALK